MKVSRRSASIRRNPSISTPRWNPNVLTQSASLKSPKCCVKYLQSNAFSNFPSLYPPSDPTMTSPTILPSKTSKPKPPQAATTSDFPALHKSHQHPVNRDESPRQLASRPPPCQCINRKRRPVLFAWRASFATRPTQSVFTCSSNRRSRNSKHFSFVCSPVNLKLFLLLRFFRLNDKK